MSTLLFMAPFFEIQVIGLPAPQGSKRYAGKDGKGRAILIDDCKRTKPWQETVKWAALEVRNRQPGRDTIFGPVAIEITFTMIKPASSPKGRRSYPAVKPDLDKLERATWDALKAVGLFEDDSRIVENRSRKVFPREHPDALDVPGALIRIWPIAAWTGYDQHVNEQQGLLCV